MLPVEQIKLNEVREAIKAIHESGYPKRITFVGIPKSDIICNFVKAADEITNLPPVAAKLYNKIFKDEIEDNPKPKKQRIAKKEGVMYNCVKMFKMNPGISLSDLILNLSGEFPTCKKTVTHVYRVLQLANRVEKDIKCQ